MKIEEEMEKSMRTGKGIKTNKHEDFQNKKCILLINSKCTNTEGWRKKVRES